MDLAEKVEASGGYAEGECAAAYIFGYGMGGIAGGGGGDVQGIVRWSADAALTGKKCVSETGLLEKAGFFEGRRAGIQIRGGALGRLLSVRVLHASFLARK